MKTLRYKIKIGMILVCALSLVLQATPLGIVYARETDNADRIGIGASSVFSPGYINAAKQRSEDILSQSQKKKGLLEQAVEYVKNRIANKVEESSYDKVIPELKKKTGGSGEGEAADTLQGGEFSSFIDPEAANIILQDALENGSSVTTLSNGNILNVWKEGSVNYYNVLDSHGNTVIAQQAITPIQDAASTTVTQIVALSNGQFLFSLAGQNYYTVNQYAMVDSSGNIIEASYYDFGSSGALKLLDKTVSYQTLRTYNSNGTVQASTDYSSCVAHFKYTSGWYKGHEYYRNLGDKVGNITSLGDGSMVMTVMKNNSPWNTYLRTMDSDFSNVNDYQVDLGRMGTIDGKHFYASYYYGPTAITSLGDGKFAVVTSGWGDCYGMNYDYFDDIERGVVTTITVMDKDFNICASEHLFREAAINTWYYRDMESAKLQSFGDGKFALAQRSFGVNDVTDLTIDIFSFGSADGSTYDITKENTVDLGSSCVNWDVSAMQALSDGSLVIAVSKSYDWYGGTTASGLFKVNSDGSVTEMNVGSLDTPLTQMISNILDFGGGDFGIIGFEEGAEHAYGDFISQQFAEQFSSTGLARVSLDYTPKTADKLTLGAEGMFLDPYAMTDNAFDSMALDTQNKALEGSLPVENLFFDRMQGGTAAMNALDLVSMMRDSITNKDMMASYAIFDEYNQTDALTALSMMLSNPTGDQKAMIDTISAFLVAIQGIKEGAMNPEEIEKAASEMIEAASAALLAQAIPDLLKEGDIKALKGIFEELNAMKGKILSRYQEATQSYYDEVIRDLANNMEALQLKNVISSQLNRKELEKLSRSEIDRIIEKLKREEKKSFEEAYILQEEAKFRKKYIDPNRKIMEESLKEMMNGFTKRIKETLSAAGGAKDAKNPSDNRS